MVKTHIVKKDSLKEIRLDRQKEKSYLKSLIEKLRKPKIKRLE